MATTPLEGPLSYSQSNLNLLLIGSLILCIGLDHNNHNIYSFAQQLSSFENFKPYTLEYSQSLLLQGCSKTLLILKLFNRYQYMVFFHFNIYGAEISEAIFYMVFQCK